MRRPTRSSRSSVEATNEDGRPKRRAAQPDYFKYLLVNNPSKAERDALKRALQESLEEHVGTSKSSSSDISTPNISKGDMGCRNDVSICSSGNNIPKNRNNNGTSKGLKVVATSSTNSSDVSSRSSSHINSSSSSNESVGNLIGAPTSKRTRSNTSLTPPPASTSIVSNNIKRAKFSSPASTNGHSKHRHEVNSNNTPSKCDTNTSVLPQVTRAIKTYSRSQQKESAQQDNNNISRQQDQFVAQNQKQSPRDGFKSSTPIPEIITSNISKLNNGSSTPKSAKKISSKQVSISRSTQTPAIKPKTGTNSTQRAMKDTTLPARSITTLSSTKNPTNGGASQSTSGKSQDQKVSVKRDKEKKTSGVTDNSTTDSSIKFMRQRPPQGSWSLIGIPEEKVIYVRDDMPPKRLICYPAIKHVEGDVIQVKDSVLLRSGAKNTDLPYIAKVYAFWEDAETSNVMMSLFWYYRPEHTEEGRKPHHLTDEIFASRHRDADSVECIEDKCYVLTFNEYCRYRKRCKMEQVNTTWSLTDVTIPVSNESYPRRNRIPDSDVNPELVFCCRQIYDSRSKRLLKNPMINSKYGHI